MEVIKFSLNSLPPKREGLTLILGNFDGFHRGHQSLCLAARIEAKSETGILFFDIDSNAYINNKKTFLMSLEDKINYARLNQIDLVYILETDSSLFNMSKDKFINNVLLPLGTEIIIVGSDYSFGKNKEGDVDYLKHFFTVYSKEMITNLEGEKISSRDIINKIQTGKIEGACVDLGHKYEIKGHIVQGKHLGRSLGFKTINIDPCFDYVLPKDGVYYGLCFINGIPYNALINVGKNPTVEVLEKSVIEAHLINFPDIDIYGKTVYVQFIKYHREERKFGSLEELKNQIQSDLDLFSLE